MFQDPLFERNHVINHSSLKMSDINLPQFCMKTMLAGTNLLTAPGKRAILILGKYNFVKRN